MDTRTFTQTETMVVALTLAWTSVRTHPTPMLGALITTSPTLGKAPTDALFAVNPKALQLHRIHLPPIQGHMMELTAFPFTADILNEEFPTDFRLHYEGNLVPRIQSHPRRTRLQVVWKPEVQVD